MLDIPAEVGDKHIEKNILEVLDAIGASVNTDLVEECHCIRSKSSPKVVILQVNLRRDSRRV